MTFILPERVKQYKVKLWEGDIGDVLSRACLLDALPDWVAGLGGNHCLNAQRQLFVCTVGDQLVGKQQS